MTTILACKTESSENPPPIIERTLLSRLEHMVDSSETAQLVYEELSTHPWEEKLVPLFSYVKMDGCSTHLRGMSPEGVIAFFKITLFVFQMVDGQPRFSRLTIVNSEGLDDYLVRHFKIILKNEIAKLQDVILKLDMQEGGLVWNFTLSRSPSPAPDPAA